MTCNEKPRESFVGEGLALGRYTMLPLLLAGICGFHQKEMQGQSTSTIWRLPLQGGPGSLKGGES